MVQRGRWSREQAHSIGLGTQANNQQSISLREDVLNKIKPRRLEGYYVQEATNDSRADHTLYAAFSDGTTSRAADVDVSSLVWSDSGLPDQPPKYNLEPALVTALEAVLDSKHFDIEPRKKQAVAATVRSLASQGYHMYVVGGAVRDLLIDVDSSPNDLDVVGDAPFHVVAKEFDGQLEEFGLQAVNRRPSVNAVLALTDINQREEALCEYAMFKVGRARRNGAEFLLGRDYIRDQQYRDVSINCLLYDVSEQVVLDPTFGRAVRDLGLSGDHRGMISDKYRAGLTINPVHLPSKHLRPESHPAQNLARVVKALDKYPDAEVGPVEEWMERFQDEILGSKAGLRDRLKRVAKELKFKSRSLDEEGEGEASEELGADFIKNEDETLAERISAVICGLNSKSVRIVEEAYGMTGSASTSSPHFVPGDAGELGIDADRETKARAGDGAVVRHEDDRVIVSTESTGWSREIGPLCTGDGEVKDWGIAGEFDAWCEVVGPDGQPHFHSTWDHEGHRRDG